MSPERTIVPGELNLDKSAVEVSRNSDSSKIETLSLAKFYALLYSLKTYILLSVD